MKIEENEYKKYLPFLLCAIGMSQPDAPWYSIKDFYEIINTLFDVENDVVLTFSITYHLGMLVGLGYMEDSELIPRINGKKCKKGYYRLSLEGIDYTETEAEKIDKRGFELFATLLPLYDDGNICTSGGAIN